MGEFDIGHEGCWRHELQKGEVIMSGKQVEILYLISEYLSRPIKFSFIIDLTFKFKKTIIHFFQFISIEETG